MIARIALRDETLVAPTWGKHRRSACLGPHRHELVQVNRTAPANRLHADLAKPVPAPAEHPSAHYPQSPRRGAWLRWTDTSPNARIAKDASGHCAIWTAASEISPPGSKARTPRRGQPAPNLRVGTLVAPTTLTEVGNPRRYSTKAEFAVVNNSTTQSSSGRVVRHRLSLGGNRRFNQIARPNAEDRRYYHDSSLAGRPGWVMP